MKDKIIELVSQITEIAQNDLLQRTEEFGLWDSMKHIEIVLSLESEFNISFSQDEITELKSISKIITTIQSKV
jgi:acyl carrier protein